MTDITKCTGVGCRQRDKCYRFLAHHNPLWQSYFAHVPMKPDGSCDKFWQAESPRPTKRKRSCST